MANKGVFGDNLEIQAFAREFQVNVKIYQRENAYVICPDNTAGSKVNDENRTTVHIAYHVSLHITLPTYRGISADMEQIWEHYSSIRNRDGPYSGPPCVREQTAISNREKKMLLDAASAILPWMEDVVAASIPQCETPERIREVLEKCKGDVGEAVKYLQDEWDSASNVNTTESTAPDDEDEYQNDDPDFEDWEPVPAEPIEKGGAAAQETPRPDILPQSQPGVRLPTVQPLAPPTARVEVQQTIRPVTDTKAQTKAKANVPPFKAQPKAHAKMVEEPMSDATPPTKDVPLPIREPVKVTTQKVDDNDDYSGAKRRKTPDGLPTRVIAAQNNSSSDETSSTGSSGSSVSDNYERRRRKPAKKHTVPPQPTRRSPRIQAKALTAAQKAAARAAAPPPSPPPPKIPRTRKPRANASTKKKTASTQKRGGAGIGMVTVGIKELYV